MTNKTILTAKIVFSIITLFASISLTAQLNKQKTQEEVQYLLQKYAHCYVDTLRGMTSQQWNERVDKLWRKVNKAKDEEEYWYALRYFGALINDYHTKFPDHGLYNRNGIFWKSDTIFPIWVKTWKDGRVFVVKDYTFCIPEKSELLEVNGYPAKELALSLRELNFGEDRYAFSFGNEQEEGDVRVWTNFTNFLFCEKINTPFNVVYKEYNSNEVKTVTIRGLTREKIYNIYKSLDKGKVKENSNFSKTPVEYIKINDSIAVLDINLFWGKNPISFLLSNNDRRFNKLIKKSMKSVADDNIKHLVIDIRGNPGGYLGSVYKTMDYLTDSTYGTKDTYRVSKESKQAAIPVLKNGYKIVYNKAEKEKVKASLSIFENMPEGSLFPVDTLLPMKHNPEKLPYRYRGKVYVLTDALSYSGSIIFCNLIRATNRGVLVGEAPGGYSIVTGGPRIKIKAPYSNFIRMDVSYSQSKVYENNSSEYHYLDMDYLIETEFDEWINNKDTKLDKLISKIQSQEL
ncbi:MAG: hypothetical protein LBL90_14245 [Prevotellaceae bacterium]|jgi:hypothetical protein|nr:hypothetical protein [Prevotellaceae bacterium]